MKVISNSNATVLHCFPPCKASPTATAAAFSAFPPPAINKTNAPSPSIPVITLRNRKQQTKKTATNPNLLLLSPEHNNCRPRGRRRFTCCRCGRPNASLPDLSSSSSKYDWQLSDNCEVEDDDDHQKFVVVNFYRFVFIKHPEEEVSRHLSFLQGLDIHGRIYLNEQGINAQYSGPSKDALAYVKWLREDHRFSDVLFQISPALSGHAFPRLKLRYKPSLVQLEEGISDLPLLDPSMRATPLSPSQWQLQLEAVNRADQVSTWNSNTNSILLDVRNGYEWDIGHFRGAQRPDVDCFRSTSFGLAQSEVNASDPLASADKEKTAIFMYCTGGIRCDVYSTILRKRGFKNLYTLKGGVSHYLKNEGPMEWVGNLFVFDSRLSIPPSTFKPEVVTEASREQILSGDGSLARCYLCDSQVSELRHRNCANLDCNLLFLMHMH
ncbi:rhodanese-like domain-containing protein 8, chloroplastic isoform X2 [Diospyros lotus]|uniref:rhodanese-like domain-containing protein 8, chloroplastic isoform X2 n=1 Tax=Diospyros lotus TaxID=55363 RepID=UPI0022543C07|nr:rhodanese-like domain-containing protein 8, chloroplastic isoform X2 [Diospyros lotus]